MKTPAPASRPTSSPLRVRLGATLAIALSGAGVPLVAAGAILVGVSACVTVNVNLPEGAVQKATDDYVRDLYRAKEKGRNNTPGAGPAATPSKTSSIGDWLVSSAYADSTVSFRVDSDKALQIRDKLAAHLDDVLAQKKAGMLGETNDGLLTVHSEGKLSALQQKRLAPAHKLVDTENTLRNELYDEVVRSNNLGKGTRKDIQKSFARSFQGESPSGTWVQDSDGNWSQKP